MIRRRDFLEMTGPIPLFPMNNSSRKIYTFEQFFLKHSTQGARLHQWLESAWLPAYGKRSALILDAVFAGHMPQIAVVAEWDSLEQAAALRVDATALEDHDEPPYEHFSRSLLEAASYSPALDWASQAPRFYELRVYHSPTWKQHKALNERFAGPEIPIFHRCGIHPVLYTSALYGEWMPNLIYFTPFDTLAAREQAWATFASDPEWIRVRAESIAADGQSNAFMQVAIYKAAGYSPLK